MVLCGVVLVIVKGVNAVSIINIGKAIAPIAKSIGDDVVRGMSKADDWGWKGGKPGEITGGEFIKDYNSFNNYSKRTNIQKKASEQLDKASKSSPVGRMWKELKDSTAGGEAFMMKNFRDLEAADFPREWTGKAFSLPNYYSYNDLNIASQIMRNLNNTERQKFIDIVVDLYGDISPEGIGKIVKSPYTDDILKMLPQWEGSVDDLIKAVELL
jgi:hypothetical protein